MSFLFSASDYKHYSLLYAEEEATYNNRFIQLLENGCLGNQPAARGRPRSSPEKALRFSNLSHQDHLLYLRLLRIYADKDVNEFAAYEQKEIARLAELHTRVVEEQKEFAALYKDLPDVRDNYSIIHPGALRFAKESLCKNLERLLRYPRQFELHLELPLSGLIESIPQFLSTPLQLGQCPVLACPRPTEGCSVDVDYDQLARRFLLKDPKEAGIHPSIGPTSEDVVGFRLALEHRASVMLELETMVVLLDNHGPNFDAYWELPLCVKQDAGSGRNVVCLDSVIPPAGFSKRRKNELCYDLATRVCMTSSNSSSGMSKAVPQAAQGSKEERAPVLIDDLFGPVEDVETFGVEPTVLPGPLSPRGRGEKAAPVCSNAALEQQEILPDSATSPDRMEAATYLSPRLRGSSRSPTKRIPVMPKGSQAGICTCASRIMMWQTEPQCAYCSQQASQEPIWSPTPSSDGLVIDELVVDKDELPDNKEVSSATPDVALTEGVEEIVAMEQSQTAVQSSGAEPTEEESAASSSLEIGQDLAKGSSEREASAMDHSGPAQDAAGSDDVPPLPDAESVSYHLFEMATSRILLRVRAHAAAEDMDDRWSVLTKLDYNVKYGAEAFTRAELVQQMAHLVFVPRSRLLRVRVDVTTSQILLTEELSTKDLPKLSSTFRPDELFYRVSYLVGRLSELQPGYYVLSHKKGQPMVDILKSAQDAGSLDLHTVVQQRTVALNSDYSAEPEEVIPLDPSVVFPAAFQGDQIPATFPANRKGKSTSTPTGEPSTSLKK